jgi:hypothetical protein
MEYCCGKTNGCILTADERKGASSEHISMPVTTGKAGGLESIVVRAQGKTLRAAVC